ncbi:MAG: cysteine hydrolase family protein [Propionivibrio sp.]
MSIGARSALTIIDMQNCMDSSADLPRNNPFAEENIAALLSAWRTDGAPIVHVRHLSRTPTSVFRPGQVGADFQPRFTPAANEHVVEKNVPDAFIHSGLERWLRVRDINGLVIVGVSTNNSVEATARSAGNLRFSAVVVADATFTFDKADFNGVLRSAEDVHAMSLANLDGEYATVMRTSDALKVLQQGHQPGVEPLSAANLRTQCELAHGRS